METFRSEHLARCYSGRHLNSLPSVCPQVLLIFLLDSRSNSPPVLTVSALSILLCSPFPLISCCPHCLHPPFQPLRATHNSLKNDNSYHFLSHFQGSALSMLHSHDSCAGGTIISPILQTRRPRQGEAKFTQLVSGKGRCPWCPVQLRTAPRVICRQILDMLRAFSGLLECVSPQGRHDEQGGKTSGAALNK